MASQGSLFDQPIKDFLGHFRRQNIEPHDAPQGQVKHERQRLEFEVGRHRQPGQAQRQGDDEKISPQEIFSRLTLEKGPAAANDQDDETSGDHGFLEPAGAEQFGGGLE